MKVESDTLFSIAASGPWLTIHSRGVAGGTGELKLNRGQVQELFQQLRSGYVMDFKAWSEDPYPTGTTFALVRLPKATAPDDKGQGGQICLYAEQLPATGRITFGAPVQEDDQMAGLASMESRALELLHREEPSTSERARAKTRATERLKNPGYSHFPPEGYCDHCNTDVTQTVILAAPLSGWTGCPVCGYTWCD